MKVLGRFNPSTGLSVFQTVVIDELSALIESFNPSTGLSVFQTGWRCGAPTRRPHRFNPSTGLSVFQTDASA